MVRILVCLILSGGTGPFYPIACGQTATQKEAQATAPGNGVTLFVSAKDETGHAVSDLKPEEIQLSEENVQQKIESFVPDSGTAVLLVVLIDMSGSRNDKTPLKVETSLLSEFLRAAIHDTDAAIIMVFNDEYYLESKLTSDMQELDQALKRISGNHPRGSTALFDALAAAARAKIPNRSGRRAILVVSDFEDNASRVTLDQAIQAAQRTQSSVFSLADEAVSGAVMARRDEKRARSSAEQLSESTGGVAFIAESTKSFPTVFSEIKSDLHSVYVLRFHPANNAHDGSIRKLKLETSRRGVKLFYSKAYFAPKD